jgi:hypothetical protein
LEPTYHNIYQVQELARNVKRLLATLGSSATGTLKRTVESGSGGVGSLSLGSVTFVGDDNPNFLTSWFIPASTGTTSITSWVHRPSTQIKATVTQ